MKEILDAQQPARPKGGFLVRYRLPALIILLFFISAIFFISQPDERTDENAIVPKSEVVRPSPRVPPSKHDALAENAHVQRATVTVIQQPVVRDRSLVMDKRHAIPGHRFLPQAESSQTTLMRQPVDGVTGLTVALAPDTALPAISKGRNQSGSALQKWKPQLYAGVSFNFSGDHAVAFGNLGVHPGFGIRLPVARKLYADAMIGLFSSISRSKENTSIKEYVNNAVDDVHYRVYTTDLIRISYIDLPLTLNYRITPQWEVGAGVEVSWLWKSKVSEKKETYDYSNALKRFEQNTFVTSAANFGAFPSQVQVQNWDTRMVLNAGWSSGRVAIKGRYHHGLAPSVQFLQDHGGVSKFKNSFISLDLQYLLSAK